MPAPEGYTSLGVIGYTDKGTYAAGTTYNKFNVVLYNGSSYVAVKDGLTGVTPTNDGVNWRLFANGFPDNGVTTDNFQTTLENYLDQTESTATNKAPSSAYLKEIKDELSGDISELTSSSQKWNLVGTGLTKISAVYWSSDGRVGFYFDIDSKRILISITPDNKLSYTSLDI